MERDEQGVIWQGTGSARQVVPQTKRCGCQSGEVPKREADGNLWAGTGSGREVVTEVKRWEGDGGEVGVTQARRTFPPLDHCSRPPRTDGVPVPPWGLPLHFEEVLQLALGACGRPEPHSIGRTA